jgi:CheY-like chemotaxis protein
VLDQNDYAATTAHNGQVALDLLGRGLVPDVILLDMLMPVLDGWRFLEELKRMPVRPVPVIAMSGAGLSAEWAADNGCADFLKKPFDDHDLFAAISRALNPA